MAGLSEAAIELAIIGEAAEYISYPPALSRSGRCNIRVKEASGNADSGTMQGIDIHLAEMAGWRALLTKAQFVARLELHAPLEEYLIGMLFRTVGAPTPGQGRPSMEFLSNVAGQIPDNAHDLRTIGDHCLLFSGLFPERAAGNNVPITYFVQVGRAAYQEFGRSVEEPIFWMLAEHFVDVMDVLQTLREVEHENVCIDPLNAYQLWRDTGSAHAWRILQRFTSALPGCEHSAALH